MMQHRGTLDHTEGDTVLKTGIYDSELKSDSEKTLNVKIFWTTLTELFPFY